VLYDKVADGVPYVVWGHSVGAWVSFEFLMAARKIGLPMPIAAFWMAFPAPHMPPWRRKWRRNRGMPEKEFKDEILRWDKEHFGGGGKIVFEEPAWKESFQPLMRADFNLFDEYRFKHDGAPRFSFPIHHWHFEDEHYNAADMIEMWQDWTTKGQADHQVMRGMGHLTCMYKPDQKNAYFSRVVTLIKKHSGL